MNKSAYLLKSGDWALFDLGPSWGGSASAYSFTPTPRTRPDRTRIKPCVTMKSLNRIAGGIAAEARFGENKFGLLGHSLCLGMHDPPDYYWDDSQLAKNMCIPSAPGKSLSGLGMPACLPVRSAVRAV